MKYLNLSFLFFLGLISTTINAQDEWSKVNPPSIPSAPAFSLLGVNPELVSRPSDVKSFKVDWRVKNYKVAPDLALEAQPLWWLYFRNLGPTKYSRLNNFQKVLSTTSLSLATAKIDNVNHISWSVKMNVFKESDPLTDQSNLKKADRELKIELRPLKTLLDSLVLAEASEQDLENIKQIRNEIRDVKYEMKIRKKVKMEELKSDAQAYAETNWNMDMIDVAFGRVYTYDNGALDSLNFNKAGYGLWVNGSKGIGKNMLITGMIRVNKVGVNTNFTLGASCRLGSLRYNFFTEAVYHRINNNPENGFLDDEQFSGLWSEDLGSGWYGFKDGDGYNLYAFSVGGDFKLNKNILLNFALRTEFKNGLNFSKFLPIANIICLMN